jgi:exopolyphosphatase/guanosine-5'-triphosphate,3'-diphosphate pyrophosphatase
MRCACIDIGSNTTRLLVAEPVDARLQEVLSRRAFTPLRGSEAAIPAEKLAEVAEEVAAQARLARDAGAERISVVATAAIRDAANRDELCEAVHAASGVEVSVLAADEEARLAFRGAVGMLERPPQGVIAVVDVGGGSSEIVCGSAGEGVGWWASFSVGSGSLADAFLHGDPPLAGELERVRLQVAETFAGLDPPRAEDAYAVGGSATSLRRLVGAVVDEATVAHGLGALAQGSAALLSARLELHPERVRVLPAAMLLLDGASRALGLPLTIASGGLREGVILEQQQRGAVV